jgi:NAD(P)-dependent dehydrogenase (short-subunit alcohol dehydrogenase family)
MTSKFAIRAFSERLREELADAPGIAVATMLPQAVHTPIFANAANYVGRRPRPIPPPLDPREVAHGIICCAETPAREVTYRYRRLGRLVELLHSLLPREYERIVPVAFAAGNYARDTAPDGAGNLLVSAGSHEIDGGWRKHERRELRRAFLASAQGGARGLFRCRRC